MQSSIAPWSRIPFAFILIAGTVWAQPEPEPDPPTSEPPATTAEEAPAEEPATVETPSEPAAPPEVIDPPATENPPADEAEQTTGTIASVTVYRGQALVTREVKLEGPQGLKEVVVTGLPDKVLPQSIYAESGDGVEVRSVRFRIRPVAEDVREEIRAIDQQLEAIQTESTAIQRNMQLAQEHKAYLDALQNFVAPTATVEMTKGVLDAEKLQALTEFQFSSRKELAVEELSLQKQQTELQKKSQLLQRQREAIAGGSSKTIREAIVFANLAEGSGGTLRLRYLVSDASWSPSYNVRTTEERNEVVVEYNAAIQQTTGEDWEDVEMTLSTATPSLVSTAPDLTALNVTLAPEADLAKSQSGPDANAEAKRSQLEQQRELAAQTRANNGTMYLQDGAIITNGNMPADTDRFESHAMPGMSSGMMGGMGGGMGGMGGGGVGMGTAASGAPQSTQPAVPEYALNSLAGQIQILDLKDTTRGRKQAEHKKESEKETVSVTYTLESAISLPSRSDQQLIQIAAMPMEAEFHKLAVPVLTDSVYEQADVVNRGDRVLLAGPTSSFIGGQFVGHGSLPTVTVGEKFTVGFGIDSSLRAHRELIEKSDETQGGNRVVAFTYRLEIENFGAEPADVRLLDRIPKSKEGELAVTLTSPGQDLSNDPMYDETERKNGILRWQVETPGEANGPEAFQLDYEFRMEYDKQMSIAGIAN